MEHKFLGEIEGTCVSKNLDETVRLQSEKREEWMREIRGEILQEIAEGTISVSRLASSSVTLFPDRNECPGIHCSLIEQEEREDSSCQRVSSKRIGWRGQNENQIGGEEKWQTCWYC